VAIQFLTPFVEETVFSPTYVFSQDSYMAAQRSKCLCPERETGRSQVTLYKWLSEIIQQNFFHILLVKSIQINCPRNIEPNLSIKKCWHHIGRRTCEIFHLQKCMHNDCWDSELTWLKLMNQIMSVGFSELNVVWISHYTFGNPHHLIQSFIQSICMASINSLMFW
jgi:hypothetical protein